MDFEFITDPDQRAKAKEAYENSVTTMKEELTTGFKATLKEEIEGMKNKNDQLLDEKKKLQEKFAGIEDPEEALAALRLVTDNEEVQMIKDGKFEEVIEKRLQTVKTEYEDELAELNKKLGLATESSETYKSRYESKTIEDALRNAAVEAGVDKFAIEDILNRGRQVFSVADDGSIEARDKDGKLVKNEDDAYLTPSNWLADHKDKAPHWWPRSTSGNYDPDSGDMDDLDRAIAKAAKDDNSDEYRRLRAKKKEMQGKN